MSTHQEQLTEVVQAAGEVERFSERGEIVEYYQDTYGDKWKSHIVSDISAQTGKSRATVAREFQYDKRIGAERYKSAKQSSTTKEKYAALGQKMPPKSVKPPKGGFKVGFKGKINPSPRRKSKGEQARERDIEVNLTGADAVDFFNDSSLSSFFEAYGMDGSMGELIESGTFEVEPL